MDIYAEITNRMIAELDNGIILGRSLGWQQERQSATPQANPIVF